MGTTVVGYLRPRRGDDVEAAIRDSLTYLVKNAGGQLFVANDRGALESAKART